MRLNHRSAPLRFVAGLVAGWTVLRIAPVLLIPAPQPVAPDRSLHAAARGPHRLQAPAPTAQAMVATPPLLVEAADVPFPLRSSRPAPAPQAWRSTDESLALVAFYGSYPVGVRPAAYVRLLPPRPAPPPFVPAPPDEPAPDPRWSGWAYAYLRQGSGARSLAPGQAQLGGSQAAARIAFRLAPRIAAAARVSAAIEDRASEAAVGVEWQALPAVRFALERRTAVDRGGRSAWSAYAAGGFQREAGRLLVDGYAQGGVVGARSADLFADGAVRVGRRIGPVLVGGGLWGAAQPGAERIDAGPRLAVRLGTSPVSLAVEHRFRLAGNARPGSGLAATLGADF